MNQRTLDILQLEAELWAVRIQMQFEENMLGERKNYATRRTTLQGEAEGRGEEAASSTEAGTTLPEAEIQGQETQ